MAYNSPVIIWLPAKPTCSGAPVSLNEAEQQLRGALSQVPVQEKPEVNAAFSQPEVSPQPRKDSAPAQPQKIPEPATQPEATPVSTEKTVSDDQSQAAPRCRRSRAHNDPGLKRQTRQVQVKSAVDL